jgi:hypothetical protein
MSKDKNEGVGRDTRVRVRAREVSRSIYLHFQHFYLSTYAPFLFSTFFLSIKVGESSHLTRYLLSFHIAHYVLWREASVC